MKIGNSAAQAIPSQGAQAAGPATGALTGKAGAPAADGKEEIGKGYPKETAGQVANRIATASNAKPSRAVSGRGNPNLDKDAFFKLMLTQVQSQDPTNPLKSHEMSAQLAQFSSLEQMSNIHSVLNDMKKAQGHDSQYQALDMIGKTISGDNGRIDRSSGDEKHDLGFVLADSASEVKVAISDAKGKVVKTIDLTNQAKGNVSVAWDGKDIDGNTLPPGTYKMSAEAKNLQGHKLSVDTKFKGAVTGVQFTERGPVMMIGTKTIPFKDVKQIEVENKQPAMMGMGAPTSLAGGLPGGKPGLSPATMPLPGPMAPATAATPGSPMLAMGGDSIMPSMQMPLNLNNKL